MFRCQLNMAVNIKKPIEQCHTDVVHSIRLARIISRQPHLPSPFFYIAKSE